MESKKIKELKEKLSNEESGSKAMGIGSQLMREERQARFEDKWLQKLKFKTEVNFDKERVCYCFEMPVSGYVEFYPKANKLFIKSMKLWKESALKFIIKNMKLDELD